MRDPYAWAGWLVLSLAVALTLILAAGAAVILRDLIRALT